MLRGKLSGKEGFGNYEIRRVKRGKEGFFEYHRVLSCPFFTSRQVTVFVSFFLVLFVLEWEGG